MYDLLWLLTSYVWYEFVTNIPKGNISCVFLSHDDYLILNPDFWSFNDWNVYLITRVKPSFLLKNKKTKQKKKGNFFRYVEHCKIQCSFAGKRFGWWVWLETGPWRCVPSRLQLSALLLSCRNRISHCRSLSLCDRFLHFGWPIHRVSFTESYSLNSTTVSQMLDLKFVIKLF